MTASELRAVALSLRQRMATMHDDILPAWNEIATWELDGDDSALPGIGDVKAVLTAYEDFSKPPLLLYEELRALKATADEETTLPESFSFESVTWDHVLEKPATFPPATHDHTTADITDLPATFPPATHDHTTADITDLPATFPPATHTHAYTDLTSTPATYPPDAHAHDYASITGKPSVFAPRMAFVTWTGNGNTTRVIAFSGDFIAQGIVATTGGGAYARMNGTGFTADTENSLTITTGSMNGSGTVYYCLIFG